MSESSEPSGAYPSTPPSGPATASPSGTAPPGWYASQWGWQWWDGARWAPPGRPAAGMNDNTLAMLAHLSAIIGGVILCGVIYATSDGRPFVRDQAREALNYNISFLIFIFGMMALIMVGVVGGGALATTGSAGGIVGGGLFVLGFGLYGLAFVAHIVFGIMGAVKASRGEAYRYPVSLRLIKD